MGDSRAVLGRRIESAPSFEPNFGVWSPENPTPTIQTNIPGLLCIELSSDQNIKRQDEGLRILEVGGEISVGRSGSLRVVPKAGDFPREIIIRDKLALNMTR